MVRGIVKILEFDEEWECWKKFVSEASLELCC